MSASPALARGPHADGAASRPDRKFQGVDAIAEVDLYRLCWRRAMVPVIYIYIYNRKIIKNP